MHYFWENIIQPIAEVVNAQHIVEVGAWKGDTTQKILHYMERSQARLDIIDPKPLFEEAALREAYPRANFQLHQERSLQQLPQLQHYDLVLLDGDHNWYTVYHELKAIEQSFSSEEADFPLVFLHDVQWPYAKRDLYYNPQHIPDAYRHAHQQAGIAYGKASLDVHYHFNEHLHNALFEGGEKNGVLTAVEDFMQHSSLDLEWLTFPLFHGLGLLLPKSKMQQNPDLEKLLYSHFQLSPPLSKTLHDLEAMRAKETADLYHQINELQRENQVLKEQLAAGRLGQKVVGKVKRLFTRAAQRVRKGGSPSLDKQQLEDAFLQHFYHSYVWYENTDWLNVPALKNPFDLWVYQEIISRQRPDFIIETGTYKGGSAFYMASICDFLGHGQVISIDIQAQKPLPQHSRIEFIEASSTDDTLVTALKKRTQGKKVLVILDSDHSERHVRKELEKYHSLVSVGSYLIVEDTIVNGHPLLPDFGPGPMEAVRDFVKTHPEFEIDHSQEKFLMSFNRSGFLKRLP